jgi:hypothetical protein
VPDDLSLPDPTTDPGLALVIKDESAGRPFVGYGGADLSNAPLDKYGFPIWSGVMGPAGRTHAAGLGQIEPATWREFAHPGESFSNTADQLRVMQRIRAARGYAPWANFNTTLRDDLTKQGLLSIGGNAPQALPSPGLPLSFGASPLMATVTQQEAGGGTPTPAAPPADGWSKLMQISMMQQLMNAGTHSFQPVAYDPFKVMPQTRVPEGIPQTASGLPTLPFESRFGGKQYWMD